MGTVHAFVFMHETDPGRNFRDVVSDIQGIEGVTFAAEFVGSFRAFAHVETPGLSELQELMANQLWEAGVRSEWSTELEVYQRQGFGPMGPKRRSPPVCVLVRVSVDRSHSLREVLAAIGDSGLTGFQGASIVTGKGFDIMLELGFETFDPEQEGDPVRQALLDELPAIGGIAGTDSSLSFVPRVEPQA